MFQDAKKIGKASLILSAFSALVLAVLSLLFVLLQPRIAAQQQSALLSFFRELAPRDDFATDFFQQPQCARIGTHPVQFERSEQGTWFIKTQTLRGYNGKIVLLLALSADAETLLGVRVLDHRETVGLGDKIERRKSAWVDDFQHRNRSTSFELKQDGGEFDAFTGATITPRAVVRQIGAIFPQWATREALPCTEMEF